ncbi:MAG: TenA family transcriptional regulator [Acidimicrobiia bacterium]|nr:TenA family transcriptional regulator [Acidimicrobiia bacterium]
MTAVRQLADRDPALWWAATHHPFLDGVRDGTLPGTAFDRWLGQDRLFVETLARAWAAMLADAPTDDLGLLADGVSAFVAEMAWLETLGAERGLAVPAQPLPAAVDYHAHLRRTAGGPYTVALAAMWAVEAAYLEAWRTALPGASAYRPFVEHWTDGSFVAFVGRVEAAADRALASASAAVVDAAADAVALTAGHEAAFWAMTWAG